MNAGNVVIRPFRKDDLEPLRQWLQPYQQWNEMDGPYYAPMSATDVDAAIDRLSALIAAGSPPENRFAIVDADDHTLLGQVTWYWESKETNWLSAGITVFDPEVRGRGVGSSALGQWTQLLFDTMPEIVRVDLRTWSGNMPMMRCAERLGFLLEARFRKARIVNGQYYDGLGYGVLREEWDAMYPGGFTASTVPAGESPLRSAAASSGESGRRA